MEYDGGHSLPFDFDPNGTQFRSKNRIENYDHHHIPFILKGNGNLIFSV